MKSSWAWMMVLVASGSGLIWAQPQIDARKLNGMWYPLAVAWSSRWPVSVPWYEIQSNDKNSFDVIKPGYTRGGGCKDKRYTYIAKEEGDFQQKGDWYVINFKDTDYNNYFIMTLRKEKHYTTVVYLYARKRYLTEEMKAKLESQASKFGFMQKYIVYRPPIFSC